MKIDPDLAFVKEIIRSGGGDLKKCFQCATCSVACELSPDHRPFPRKEMIWAQWGLKEKLVGNPDIWLCHQCNDCSVQCPRGVKPGDVMAALRRLTIAHYALPRFMGRAVNRPAMLPLLFLVPAVVILAVLGGMWSAGAIDASMMEHVEYASMFPHAILNTFFTLLVLIAGFALAVGLKNFWRDMNRMSPAGDSGKRTGLIPALFSVAADIGSHALFRKCTADRHRNLAHLLVIYGFAGLIVVTLAAIVYILLHLEYPLAQSNPFKVLGNLSAAALLVGLLIMIFKRLGGRGGDTDSTYFDWCFLWVLLGVVVTGILNEILRLANLAVAAYPMYFVHLVFIFFLFVYAPYSKMAHLFYRTTAMVHARVTGREESSGEA